MLFTVKTLLQKIFTIEAEQTETVLDFKVKIQAAQGFNVASQKLIHAGVVLVDAEPLSKYNVTEKTFIVVMVTKEKAAPTTAAPKPVPKPVEVPVQEAPVVAAAPAVPFTESSLASGGEYELAVNNLCDMGFERDQVKAAMRAAFNNPDRAAEYLMTVSSLQAYSNPQGIPESGEQAQAPQATAAAPLAPSANLFEQAAHAAALAQQSAPAALQGDASTLDFLRNSPQFEEMRNLIRTQPHLLQPMLMQLAQSNPEVIAMINSNRDGFMRMLTEGMEGGMEGGEEAEEGTGQQYIQVTPEENESITRLVALGFDRSIAIEAYFACDKNEELAANYLFDNGGEDDWQ